MDEDSAPEAAGADLTPRQQRFVEEYITSRGLPPYPIDDFRDGTLANTVLSGDLSLRDLSASVEFLDYRDLVGGEFCHGVARTTGMILRPDLRSMATLQDHIPVVFKVRPAKEMSGTHTGAPIALVADTFWKESKRQRKRDAVSQERKVTSFRGPPMEPSISSRVFRAGPVPAAIAVGPADKGPKPFSINVVFGHG